MTMTSYDKHLKFFIDTSNQLNKLSSEHEVRKLITKLMLYLDKNHLVDKNYLKHSKLFLSCEVNLELLSNLDAETYLSFLTMIYRIDYIDPNSDAFMIYYKNKMIEMILNHLITKLKEIKGD